jgi:hypothetical protein
MALKDLKSDLSKFRMPKKDPLENKKIDEVNKKIKSNSTIFNGRFCSKDSSFSNYNYKQRGC